MKRNKQRSIGLLASLLILFLGLAMPAWAQKSGKKTPAKKTTTTKTTTGGKTTTTKTTTGGKTTTDPAKNTTAGTTTTPDADVTAYKEQARQMVGYLEYLLNELAGEEATAEEKNIMINQSFSKIFRDGKVQVEDDLDEKRLTVTNKDIQAYLKDVDFFFTRATFELAVEDVEVLNDDNRQNYIKVSLTRRLAGRTVDDDSVNSSKARYIEIAIDPANKDLKIASIYTTKLDETQELSAWWNNLGIEWKMVFRKYVNVGDTATEGQLKAITALESIDLAGTSTINSLEPLTRLTNLKVLDASETAIGSISPLRNLAKIEHLHLSKTQVSSLAPLRYAYSLKELLIENTQVTDLEVLGNYTNLEKLYIDHTSVSNLAPLAKLTKLRELRLTHTQVSDLSPLANLAALEMLDVSHSPVNSVEGLGNLPQLERLTLDYTQVRQVDGLRNLKRLRLLFANNTPLSSIEPLNGLTTLEKIYCDNSGISREKAVRFMTARPGCLVIYDSESMTNWWTTLSEEWKLVFHKYVKTDRNPTKEQLAQMALLTAIDLSNNLKINSLEPLKLLPNLTEVKLANTGVSDLSPLKDLIQLETLVCASSPVKQLDALADLSNLALLNLEGTATDSTSAKLLVGMKSLKNLYLDKSRISKTAAERVADALPNCLVVYRTEALSTWWKNLPAEWKGVFSAYVKTDNTPTKEQLHQIAALEVVNVADNTPLRSLEPLLTLRKLKELRFTNTYINDLSPLSRIKTLEVLQCAKNPIGNLAPLAGLPQLYYLDFEGTAIEELEPLAGLPQLKDLRFSGTQIKDLKPLASVRTLERIDFSSTPVRAIKPLEELPKLVFMKCFNTKVWSRTIAKFKETRPKSHRCSWPWSATSTARRLGAAATPPALSPLYITAIFHQILWK
jgi:Leucine-rich repeat (LRR) protein